MKILLTKAYMFITLFFAVLIVSCELVFCAIGPLCLAIVSSPWYLLLYTVTLPALILCVILYKGGKTF